MGQSNNTKHINETMNNEVSEKTTIPSFAEAMNKLSLKDTQAYIEADPYIADPYALLGQVLQIRKKNGICPESLNDPDYSFEFSLFPVRRKVNENSKLRKPELRSSIVVDEKLAANVSFLHYLKSQFKANSYFSLMVFDQASGLIDTNDENWSRNVQLWKADNTELVSDPEICYLFVIMGFVQKNIVRKTFIKYEAGASGGCLGTEC